MRHRVRDTRLIVITRLLASLIHPYRITPICPPLFRPIRRGRLVLRTERGGASVEKLVITFVVTLLG